MGRGAPLRRAAALADLDVTKAHGLIDHLVASGLLGRAGDGYTLTHPLVAGALYRGLPGAERSRLHRRAAACLAGERADVESVGQHLLHSEPAGEPWTVTTLRAAAARANQRGTPETAATYLARALLEPPAAPSIA